MKKYRPDEMMPDEGTEVLGYFGSQIGFAVADYVDGDWVEPWTSNVIGYEPEYWIDLTDIEDNLK